MAFEWVKVEGYGANDGGQVIRYAIADGAAVSIGTLLALIDPRTVSGAASGAQVAAGVAAEEHVPNAGVTDISVETQGRYRVTASGAITVGTWIKPAGHNMVASMMLVSSGALAASYACIIGRAEQQASGGDEITVRLNL